MVEDINQAVESCPVGCKLLIIGDLNANNGFPCNKQEEVIFDLLNKLCLVDSLRGFWLWTPCRTATRERWMWSQQRGDNVALLAARLHSGTNRGDTQI